MYKKATIYITGVLGVLVFLSFKNNETQVKQQAFAQTDTIPKVTPWVAPAPASAVKNPLTITDAVEDKGEAIFILYCKPCHGEAGYGDGPMGAALEIKPANFHSKTFKAQTDGAIFWKLTTGRGVMAPFKEVLTEEQRWQVIAFLRVIPE